MGNNLPPKAEPSLLWTLENAIWRSTTSAMLLDIVWSFQNFSVIEIIHGSHVSATESLNDSSNGYNTTLLKLSNTLQWNTWMIIELLRD